MANGISKNPLTDISKVYLDQIAEGSLKSLEKASVLAMSDDPKDQDKAREIKTRFDYQSLMKQKKAKKGKVMEARSDWRHDLREIIVTPDKDSKEPQIKEKKIKNKIQVNPEFKEAVEEIGGELLTVEEVDNMADEKKAEQRKRKEKMLKKRMLMMKLRAVQQTGGEDVVAGYEPEGEMVNELSGATIASYYTKAMVDKKKDRQAGMKQVKKIGQKMSDGSYPITPGLSSSVAKKYADKSRKTKKEEFVDEAKYEAGASNYGKMSIRNKRAVGYGGNAAPPEERRKAHAERMKKHKGVTEATRYAKETGKSFKSGKPVVKGGTAKDDKAFQAVAKKYAGQMMGGPQKKKVRGQKPDESNTPFKRAAERMKKIKMDNKALADKAKKAGYKSTQDYVNVQAVRKGGLGT